MPEQQLTETTVVNIKHCPDFNPSKNPNDVYIGRYHRSERYGFMAASPWCNPFRIDEALGITRDDVIAMYRDHILTSPELVSSLHELKGKRLGCWCKPEACHGDVLIKLLKED